MNRLKKILALFFSLLFCACTSALKQPASKTDFYTLEYNPPQISDPEGAKQLPVVIKIDRFSMAPEYNTNQMIYRDKSFKRNVYNYHAWRARAGDLVSYFLSRDMKQSGLFKGVFSPDSRSASSHVLEGSVDEFFEWDTEKDWKAVLTVSVTLLLQDEPDISKRIIFQKSYNTKEICKKRNPKALAEAMSQAMKKISAEIIKDIYDSLM
jgi:cholesterol transport system auxiliary component